MIRIKSSNKKLSNKKKSNKISSKISNKKSSKISSKISNKKSSKISNKISNKKSSKISSKVSNKISNKKSSKKSSKVGGDENQNTMDKLGKLDIIDIFNKLPNNFIMNTNLLNKTSLYNIKNNISNYYISNAYDSELSYIIIYGNNVSIIDEIHFNRSFINKNNFNKDLFYNNIKNIDINVKKSINTYSLIKCYTIDKKLIISSIIIDDSKFIIFDNDKTINELNKKYANLLSCEFITYSKLDKNNYKKCLSFYNKSTNINKKFVVFTNFVNSQIIKWTSYPLGINFLCKKCNSNINKELKELGYLKSKDLESTKSSIYLLFLTTNKNDFTKISIKTLPFYSELFPSISLHDNKKFPLQFSPSNMPNAFIFTSSNEKIDNKIINLSYDINDKNWIFNKISNRNNTDFFGDSFKTTELNIWNSYFNPIHFTDLNIDTKKIEDDVYFIKDKNNIHEAPLKLNQFVKNSLIKNYGGEKIIDLAGGRGSDLFNYRLAGIKNILYMEVDNDAIDELIFRKYKFDNPNNTQTNIINTNLNDSFKNNIKLINNFSDFNKGVSMVYCFFALHYLTDNLINMKNIVCLINSILNKGGSFLYTAFDEKKLVNLLKKNKGKWEVMEKTNSGQNIKKYSIKVKSKSFEKDDFKKIKLILPFNTSEYYYDEVLINEKKLDIEFKKQKILIKKEGSFSDFLDKFKTKKNHFYNKLTESDKIFIDLYKYKIYGK